MGPDIDQRDVLVAAVRRQRRRDQAERLLGRVGFDIHHARLEARRLGDGHPILDFFLARGRDQNLDFVRVVRCGSEDLEVEVDLVQGERNVLVRLGFDGKLELFLLLTRGHDDLLGDDHGGRQRERDVAIAAAQALPSPLERIADLIEIGDVPVGDHVLRERLDRVSFETEGSLPGIGELDELQGRRRNVDSDERRRLRLEEF